MGYQELNTRESLSGLGEQQVLMMIPAGAYDMIAPTFAYTVTDAGIAAGETIFDAISRIRLYEEGASQAVFDLTAAQWAAACHDWRPGNVDETNVVFNPLPTTAVECLAQSQLHMPIILDQGINYLELTLNAGSEWAGATAFTGTFTFQYEPGIGPAGYGIETPTVRNETNQRVDLSYFNQTIIRTVVDGIATANDVTNVKLESSDGGYDVDMRNPVGPAMQYNLQRDQLTTMANVKQGMDFNDLASAHHINRELQMELGVAAQPEVRVYYIDSIAAAIVGSAGDVARGTAEVAPVKMDSAEISKSLVTEAAETGGV